MKAYIGTKIVHAEPMDDPNPPREEEPAAGYKVVYEDGYLSWSPKDVFERCYREVTQDEYALVCTGDES
jgi:hypothetical protein